MELTLDQALRRGIEAHKAGKVQEADRYYTAILKSNPKHADANHNMGVLAVDIGKLQQALPFFKTALEANPSIDQFWLSYIDALIKLGQIVNAKAVFNQAKSNGAKGVSFDKLEKRIGSSDSKNIYTRDPPKKKLASLFKLYNQQKLKQVFNEAQKLSKRYSKSLTLWNLMGASAAQIGKLDKAVIAFQKALLIEPDYADAHYNMGNAFKDQEKLEEATEAYKKALSIKPDYAEALLNMGNVLKDQGMLEEAIESYNKALSIKPDYAEACFNLGNALSDQAKLEEAIQSYNNALTIKSDYAEVHNSLGNALIKQGQIREAIEAYKKALSIKSNYAEVYNNMGNALQEKGRLEEAIESYNKALTIEPDYPEACLNLGIALTDQGKLDKAIKAYNKALTTKPDYAEVYNNLGNALREKGMVEEAIKAYNKALSIESDYAEAHRNLSHIKRYTADDKQFLQAQELYKLESLSDDKRCNLIFALAKMYEDIGKIDEAFSYLFEGNALRKKLLRYSINQDKDLFSRLKETQPHLLINSKQIKKSLIGPKPIFILGMPRSGTTLVEQVISSHSEVVGAGELDYVQRFGKKLSVDPKSVNFAAISEFKNRYLAEITKLSNGKHFVIDKMPHNFRFIPLICAAFPEAKIVHVKRNPAATCWSNYKQYFMVEGLGYCYDLKDVVSYYSLYSNLMKFWKLEYEDRIYNLNYEKLTTNQENETKKLIKHLELNWEQACLSPHKNKRIVRTASQQQVRQKVFQGSSEAWRKYEVHINDAFDSLPSS